ncbi:MAG: DUF2220 family protein [Microcella pacifica]|uniref:Wadjet protein JetD C-terminal domain-containing protein n=1 Tax=Microcella pacifica TaxID=2591847 RepID=A0A9E5JMI8_9MICO|nr:Wadjet anti-phage system protein JetD domain-containing protein [Microcella pacifica]MBR22195.1 hypothetical protein [Leifsonia sp.]MBU1251212.1 hypothetical protein [Actinomycetota bacterium]MBU1608623.1 hypothetical protein [Actinomycetota bacterium]MBU2316681.1 hypothetical protein [Actinomycetota bacterium]NHF63314.1 hypothetical protein [Microcella pacifica]
MSDPERWTTPSDIAAAVRQRWRDGELLRAYVAQQQFPRIEVALRGPVAADLGVHFDAARTWADSVRRASRDGRGFDIVHGRIGGRLAGATDIPTRAVVSRYEQAWALLGVADQATVFASMLDAAVDTPRARTWALSSPVAAIALAAEWTTMLAACAWLDTHRDTGLYVRQASAPGVDTKFIERHRRVLAAMLDVPAGKRSFEVALGLAIKPSTVRLRFDPAVMGMPRGLTEAVVRTDELNRLTVRARRALIVENEITYLSVPVAAGCVVLWGKGYEVDEPASLSWLNDMEVDYWGDLDTHGFSILNRVRTRLPHVTSVLMDRETLLAHQLHWSHESSPTSAALRQLNGEEAALYSDIVTDRYGQAIRLEQELINWEWATQRITESGHA